MFETLLVANRGEIARRVIRTASGSGSGRSPCTPRPTPTLPCGWPTRRCCSGRRRRRSRTGHRPGARGGQGHRGAGDPPRVRVPVRERRLRPRRADAGLVWVGPRRTRSSAMGDKINARNLMAAAGVPVAARHPRAGGRRRRGGSGRRRAIGYPVMVKAAAGGGGMGMAVVGDEAELRAAVRADRARSPSGSSATPSVLHRAVPARGRGTSRCRSSGWPTAGCVALGERDCSVQRRNQKIAEETPVAGRHAGAARADAGRRGARRRGGRLPQRRHRRVPGRPGRRTSSSSWR